MAEALDWLNEYGTGATADDFAEQREKLSDVAHPITSSLYDDADLRGGGRDEFEDVHDEL